MTARNRKSAGPLKNINKRRIATLCLFLGTFFCPFGFDALFKVIMEWTGSYWTTDLIFYLISGLFFGFYFFLNKFNKNSSESSE
jgi:hypothetical protein